MKLRKNQILITLLILSIIAAGVGCKSTKKVSEVEGVSKSEATVKPTATATSTATPTPTATPAPTSTPTQAPTQTAQTATPGPTSVVKTEKTVATVKPAATPTPISAATPTPTTTPAVQTLTGYIEDEDCFVWFIDKANNSNPGEDSKGCLEMKGCATSGYGIAVHQNDGSYKFYYLDGNFSSFDGGTFVNGTGSQLSARNLIVNTASPDHISIKVTGTLNGNTKVSPYDGISYPVITVTNLSESVLKSLVITHDSNKLTYTVGDKLDISDLEVTGTYDDDSKAVIPITADDIKGFDSSKPVVGQTLTITVGGKTATYKIDINSPVQTITGYIEDVDCFFGYKNPADDTKGCLSMHSCAKSGYGITVPQSDGTKKYYFFDGTFATFADGKTFDGTGSQLSAWNLIQNTTKKNNVTITVKGILSGDEKTYVDSSKVSHSFPVLTVTSLAETSTLNSIEITTPAAKLTYSVGDALDLTGLKVTGTYDDNTKVLQSVAAANVTGFDSSKPVDGQVLTVTVGGKTTTYTIKVKQAPVSIAITKPANKLVYSVKDKLDITGLEVTATYSDGTTAVIPVTALNVTGFNSSAPASSQILTITAGGKTVTYTIKINSAAQTFTGYIEDEDCFVWYTDPANNSNPGEDSKMCLLMGECAASGYGIAVLQSDGTYKFYYLDGGFAPGATGTQALAKALIQNSIKSKGISIEVKGYLNGDTKTAADGKTYPVITVTSLVEK